MLANLFIGYMAIGVLVLCAFTPRIKRKLRMSVAQAQAALASKGAVLGTTTATVVMLFAVWLFWPALIYGMLVNHNGGRNEPSN